MKQIIFAVCIGWLALTTNGHADSSKATSAESVVILINPFIVPDGKLDETLAMWEQANDFLKEQPGYISTELHQSLSPDAPYHLINVAKWESVEAFKAATAKMRASANLPRIEGVKPAPQLYTVVRN